jgi:hypothetical protein
MECIHHIPGRLRLKLPALKGQPQHAAHLAALFDGHPQGVTVQVNPRTGSLLLQYDPQRVQPETLIASVCQVMPQTSLSARVDLTADPTAKLSAQLTNKLGAALADKLLATVVERSALALLAALI